MTIAEALSAVAEQNENHTGGVALTSDSTMVEASVTAGSDDVVSQMRQAVGENFDRLVRVVKVEYSTTELLAARAGS